MLFWHAVRAGIEYQNPSSAKTNVTKAVYPDLGWSITRITVAIRENAYSGIVQDCSL
jgi:hypothetical protein